MLDQIKFIDEVEIKDKRVLLRVDFNLSLDKNHQIADDFRLKKSLPTIQKLLADGNKLTLVSHLDDPHGVQNPDLSLQPVVEKLKNYLRDFEVLLGSASTLRDQSQKQIFVLENIRFYKQEYDNDPIFAKELAGIADVFVNDAFSVCHRDHASVVGVPKLIPAYGGLQLKREIEMISKVVDNPQRPFVAIIGGVKEDKVTFANKLLSMADHVLIGSGMVKLIKPYDKLVLPEDFIVADGTIKKKEELSGSEKVFDIGPETEALFGSFIDQAKTIIWAGPVGNFENPSFRRGTEFIYYAIAQNSQAHSVVGGGDTLSAISKEEYLNKITHISTGGGAMLEFIEQGTLPGLEALKN